MTIMVCPPAGDYLRTNRTGRIITLTFVDTHSAVTTMPNRHHAVGLVTTVRVYVIREQETRVRLPA